MLLSHWLDFLSSLRIKFGLVLLGGKGSLLVLCRIYQKTGAGPRKPRALYGAPFIEEEQEDAPQDLVQGRNALAVPDVTVDAALDVGVDAAQEQNHICFSEDSEQVLYIHSVLYKIPLSSYSYCFSHLFSSDFG